MLLFCSVGHALETRIGELEFKEAGLVDAIRIISELSGDNIVATPGAAQAKVTLYLRNVTVGEAVETLCRVNNLWYRHDAKSDTWRIMTNAEYSQDLVIHRDESTRVFTLRNPNVELVADAIANLYGERVELSQSGASGSAEGNGDGGNDGEGGAANGGNGVAAGAADLKLTDRLSVDQLAAMRAGGAGNNLISATQLQRLSAQREPIFVTTVAEHNLVVVRSGDKEAMAGIADLVQQLDRPVPQVLLEMKILDVLVGDDFKSVFNFAVTGSSLSRDSTSPILLGNNASIGGSFVFEYLNDRLKANIEFLAQDNRVRVLSTPMVLASNNRPATLFVGEQRVLVTGYETAAVQNTGDNASIQNENVVPVTALEEIGNSIEITPYINADNTITLELKQESSTVKNAAASIAVVSGAQVLQLPMDTVTTARLEGTVIAKDEHTIAVGGLVRETKSDQEQSVPGLASLPLLGKLFRSVKQVSERSELILMITPHLINASDETPTNTSVFDVEGGELSLMCGELCRF